MPDEVSKEVDPVAAWRDRVNASYKAAVAEFGGKFKALKMARFSSGVLSLDAALGGGWPFHRIACIAGEESTGKTAIALTRESEHACGEIAERLKVIDCARAEIAAIFEDLHLAIVALALTIHEKPT